MLSSRICGSPDDVDYWKNVLQLFVLFVGSVWLIHSMVTGRTSEIKRAVASA